MLDLVAEQLAPHLLRAADPADWQARFVAALRDCVDVRVAIEVANGATLMPVGLSSFDEQKIKREQEPHDGKRPGEFAPKEGGWTATDESRWQELQGTKKRTPKQQRELTEMVNRRVGAQPVTPSKPAKQPPFDIANYGQHSEPNPLGFDRKNFPKGVNGPAVSKAVIGAVQAQQQANSFSRLTLPQVYEHAKRAQPDLTYRDFQGTLAKLAEDRAISLGPYTQSLSTHPNPELLMPLDRDRKWYVGPAATRLSQAGSTAKAPALVHRFPDLRQINHFSCGSTEWAACCVLRGIPMTVGEAEKILGTTVERSTSPWAIVEQFRRRGIEAVPREPLAVADLARETAAGNPVILCVQDYGNRRSPGAKYIYGHYIAALEVTPSGIVLCHDPSIQNVEREPGGDVPKSEVDRSGNIALPGIVPIAAEKLMQVWHDQDSDGNKLVQFGIVVGPRTDGVRLSQTEFHPIAAGLAVCAEDTGRVLMLQRSLAENDPAGGTWEFPGGHIDGREMAERAAMREWQEEVGLPLPTGKTVADWQAHNGRYRGFVYAVPREEAVALNSGRDFSANPDGDTFEAVAWVDPEDFRNHNLRPELLKDIRRVRKALAAVGESISLSSAPDPELQRDRDLEEAVRNWDRHVYFRSETGEVWVTTHDSDSDKLVGGLVAFLKKIPTVHKVHVEPEAGPPHGRGWVQIVETGAQVPV